MTPELQGETMVKLDDLHPDYVTGPEGERKSVIIPFEEFQELLEDIEDLAVVAERRDEPTVSHDDLVRELKEDGLI